MSIKIKDMIKDFEVDATYIAKISCVNRVKGIHPIKDDKGQIESVAILCTINGESYQING
ncbi:hypothetical protein LL033_09965 [Clostridium estertheticum]|uniref:hypothetical protein n=1 Tax=Clostridium estertheticum TaxID=238834 RepID=UPI001C0D6E70|nr:hypothetical protein [Clostridium estertheticum]MBU3217794.1 hypothetical protein [Clostridium estertheticum]WAG57481.1 hypothetical protein LL033_09965 [Clostridium estertheticum]